MAVAEAAAAAEAGAIQKAATLQSRLADLVPAKDREEIPAVGKIAPIFPIKKTRSFPSATCHLTSQ